MEKDINQLIIKEFKKRIENLEKEVQNLKNDNNYLRGRLDQLTIPNLNIKTYDIPLNPKQGSGYWPYGGDSTVIC